MRIACDNCQTGYDIDASVLGTEGREVRCSNCKTTWFARPTTPEEPIIDDVIDVAADPDEPMLQDGMELPERKSSLLAKLFGLLRTSKAEKKAAARNEPTHRPDPALAKRQLDLMDNLPPARMRRNIAIFGVGVLSSVFIAGLVFSSNVVRAVPDLASLYQAVGLNVNAQNIAFEDITSEVRQMNGKPTLVVQGQLRNIASKQVDVPNIQVSLLAEGDKEIYTWAVQPSSTQLGKGAKIDFETLLVTPPEGAKAVELIFEMPKS